MAKTANRAPYLFLRESRELAEDVHAADTLELSGLNGNVPGTIRA
jgi:hypothetical protein